MTAAGVAPEAGAVILRVRSLLKKNLSVTVLNKNRKRAMKLALAMCIDLGACAKRLIVGVYQQDRFIRFAHEEKGSERREVMQLDAI
jgi:hypothetical protein